MKINEYQQDNLTENYLDLYYRTEDSEVMAVRNLFRVDKRVLGRNGRAREILAIRDIYYFEIVDRKCFAYLHSGVFEVDINLQTILDCFGDNGFLRISKSMVVNVFKLSKIKSDINMRVHAVLANGETVVINRTYKRSFYQEMRKLLRTEELYETTRP